MHPCHQAVLFSSPAHQPSVIIETAVHIPIDSQWLKSHTFLMLYILFRLCHTAEIYIFAGHTDQKINVEILNHYVLSVHSENQSRGHLAAEKTNGETTGTQMSARSEQVLAGPGFAGTAVLFLCPEPSRTDRRSTKSNDRWTGGADQSFVFYTEGSRPDW